MAPSPGGSAAEHRSASAINAQVAGPLQAKLTCRSEGCEAKRENTDREEDSCNNTRQQWKWSACVTSVALLARI